MKRSKLLLILFVLGLAASVVSAEPSNDLSVLAVTVDENASLILSDAGGHLTGVDPTIPKMYQEIPESNGGDVPLTHTVSIFHPQGTTYEVILIGTNLGSYKLEMTAYSMDGTLQPKMVLQGNTAPGVKAIYDITYQPEWAGGDDGSMMSLHE